jgi:uncharacterized phiE125 gp8 family phage protein
MKSEIVTPATVELITPSELSEHTRIDINTEDAYFETRITAARQAAEARTQSVFITQTWDDSFDWFFDGMLLTKQPVQSITSVTYTNTDGTPTVVADTVYELATVMGLGGVRLKYQQVWPTDVQSHPDSVVVRYVAGYGLAVDVPQEIKSAIEIYVSHFNEAREGEVPMPQAFNAMLGPYCFYRFANP